MPIQPGAPLPPMCRDDCVLRRATIDDAAQLSVLAERTFTETFGHLYPPEDLRAFVERTYALERQRIILAHPDYAVWLLEHRGEAVGHVAAGPCGLPHPAVRRGDGELKRLYLLTRFQAGGRGARMMQAALEWLLRDGPRPLWVGVWSENLGAQRFYARHGFQRVGEYRFAVGRVHDLEYILRRDARPLAGATGRA